MAITRQEVDAMYMDLFGRTAKDAGAKYWMDKVSSGFTTAEDLPRHLKYAANTTEKGRAELAYGDILRQQAAEQAAKREQREQEAVEQLATQTERYDAGVARQEEMINLLREQQAAQLLAQQRLQEQISTGMQGKGGTQQQQAQSAFGDAAPQPTQETMQEPAMMTDIDTGGGYYRNPYASGFGMGYQDPYAGMRYMPQRGLMGGPSGFGGKGGYSQPMYSPYGYSPYGGMSPGKGGYSPPASMPPSGYTQTIDAIQVGASPDLPPETAPPIVGADGSAPYYSDTPVVPTNTMDIADADPTQTIQEAAIAADGSNVVDFTPYTGDEFVRIGDQTVSRADLQRRGSDYYTRPIQAPPMRRQMYPMYGGKGGYYR
jgi:hypothetical protein